MQGLLDLNRVPTIRGGIVEGVRLKLPPRGFTNCQSHHQVAPKLKSGEKGMTRAADPVLPGPSNVPPFGFVMLLGYRIFGIGPRKGTTLEGPR